MDYLVEGLLGGIGGAADATKVLSLDALEEKRRREWEERQEERTLAAEGRQEKRVLAAEERAQLAANLKAKAQAALKKVEQEREFTHDKDLAGIKAKHKEGLAHTESRLKRGDVESEIQAKKKAGILGKKPTVLNPNDIAIDASGKKIAEGKASAGSQVKTSDKINARKSAINALHNLAKPKKSGGIGWKRGDPIPQGELDRINQLLRVAGEEEIPQNEKSPSFWDKLFGGDDKKHTPKPPAGFVLD